MSRGFVDTENDAPMNNTELVRLLGKLTDEQLQQVRERIAELLASQNKTETTDQ